jgi:prepilin-type N-terminal cleavage/methylation domain-containing protein
MTAAGGTSAKRGADGFTLVEIVVVIAVISILASMAVPFAAKMLDSARETNTRQRMQDLHKAILGDPATGTHGFVGDMGRLPNGGVNALQQLNTQGAQPGQPGAALPAAELGIQRGWNGPYVNASFDTAGYRNDGWGRPLRYGPAAAAAVPPADRPVTGNYPALLAGQMYSAGPDAVAGTGDDIVFPSAAVSINGRLLVNVLAWDNATSQFVRNPTLAGFPGMTGSVRIYSSNGGAPSWMQLVPTLAPAVMPPYAFPQGALVLPAGLHAVQGACTLPGRPATAGQAIVAVPPNNQQTVLDLYLR